MAKRVEPFSKAFCCFSDVWQHLANNKLICVAIVLILLTSLPPPTPVCLSDVWYWLVTSLSTLNILVWGLHFILHNSHCIKQLFKNKYWETYKNSFSMFLATFYRGELIYCHVLICTIFSPSVFNLYHLTRSWLVYLPPMLIIFCSEIYLNIFLPAVCQSFRWVLSHQFFPQNSCVHFCPFCLNCMCTLSSIITIITPGNVLHYVGPKIVHLLKWCAWHLCYQIFVVYVIFLCTWKYLTCRNMQSPVTTPTSTNRMEYNSTSFCTSSAFGFSNTW